MTKVLSFSKVENALIPRFRDSMAQAESTADVQKFFVYTMLELLNTVLADAKDNQELHYEDVWLVPEDDGGPNYGLSPRLGANETLVTFMLTSDLPAILTRFADVAGRRYRYLAQKPEKTEAKMYHGTGRAAR